MNTSLGAVLLSVVLALCGALAGFAAGWAIFGDGDGMTIEISRQIWMVAGSVTLILLLVGVYLGSPQHFRELVTWLLVVYLVGGAIVLGVLLISLWAPSQATLTGDAANTPQPVHLIGTGINVKLHPATMRLVLILTSGAAGGVVNALWVFVARTGNASFRERWAWWYVAGPIFGAASAYGLSLAFGGNLVEFGVPVDSDPDDVGLLAFVGFVAGLFAKAVLERLSRLLPEPSRRTGPRITSVAPSVIPTTATTSQMVEIQGTGFTESTKVYLEGEVLQHTRDGNKLTVTVDPATVATRPIALEVVAETREGDVGLIRRI